MVILTIMTVSVLLYLHTHFWIFVLVLSIKLYVFRIILRYLTLIGCSMMIPFSTYQLLTYYDV